MKKIIQRGENPEYPKEIQVWREKDTPTPPTWLSDRCRINKISGEKYEFDIREFTDGSYEILSPERMSVVRVAGEDDYICFGDIDKYRRNQVFSLTEKQFNLLYKTE